MSQETLNELIRKSEGLTAEEKLKLIGYLSETLKRQYEFTEKPRRSWREVGGLLNDSLCGEDAQEWVTRTRSEATEHREKIIRGES
jgi:hypothetical protein